MSPANQLLFDLFQAHGVHAVAQGEYLTFPGKTQTAWAEFINQKSGLQGTTLQLNIHFRLSQQQTITESFAGLGKTVREAYLSGFQNFATNSFHVLLGAYFQEDEHVNSEDWILDGIKRRVICSNAGIRSFQPLEESESLQQALATSWFDDLKKIIQLQSIGKGTHWLRIYYAQHQKKQTVLEVLKDNQPWPALIHAFREFKWPVHDDFFSIRLFLIVPEEKSPTVAVPVKKSVSTLADVIKIFVEIFAEKTATSESEIYDRMSVAGVPRLIAVRALQFTQVAWGRLLLEHTPLIFPPDFYSFDAEGTIIQHGQLEDEPLYRAAIEVGQAYRGTTILQEIAYHSHETHAVYHAIKAGLKAETLDKLHLAPSLFLPEVMTPEGEQKVDHFIQQQTDQIKGSLKEKQDLKRPFWRRRRDE